MCVCFGPLPQSLHTHVRRRKNPVRKYDPPYIKKPMVKHGGSVNANHRSVEEVSLDGSNKLITYGNQASFR